VEPDTSSKVGPAMDSGATWVVKYLAVMAPAELALLATKLQPDTTAAAPLLTTIEPQSTPAQKHTGLDIG
jgi:hypothetical protein